MNLKPTTSPRQPSRGPTNGGSSTPPGSAVLNSVVTTGLVIVSGLVSGIVAARALGVTGRGELAAALLWPVMVTSLADLGLSTAFVYLAASDRNIRCALARNVLPLVLAQWLLICLVGVPVILAVLDDYSLATQQTAVIYLFTYGPLYTCVRYLLALNQGAGRFAVYNMSRILVPGLTALLLLVLVLCGVTSVRMFALAFVAPWLIALIALLRLSPPAVRWAVFRPRVDWTVANMAWSIGSRAYFGSLALVDTLQIDVLLATWLMGRARQASIMWRHRLASS